MIETVSEWRFIDAFMNIRPDNFTRSGLQALYDYFIQFEDDLGEQIELDVLRYVAISLNTKTSKR